VVKTVPAVAREAGLADRTNMVYAGMLVSSSKGRGVVVATGSATEIGRVHHLVAVTRSVDTPLTRKLGRFSGVLTVVILGLAALGVAVEVLRGQPFAEVLTAAVALAVGAIPEGLPAAVTVTLAIGMRACPVAMRTRERGAAERSGVACLPVGWSRVQRRPCGRHDGVWTPVGDPTEALSSSRQPRRG